MRTRSRASNVRNHKTPAIHTALDDATIALVCESLRRGESLPMSLREKLFPQADRRPMEYELTYGCKEREEDILADTWSVPFQTIKALGDAGSARHSDPNGAWVNQLIFGDNLQALKHLLNDSAVRGQVRLVYIDPPFATKQEFQSGRGERAYADKVAGAQFIEFLRKRLVILRELLTDDGSLVVHLDYRKVHYVKVILDEVFGEANLRNEVMLPGRASKNLQQQFETVSRLNVRHETLLWYSRSAQTRFSPLWIKKHSKGNPEGHWHHFWSTANRPTMRYELFGHKPTTGQWTWKEERTKCAVENYKRFLKEAGGRKLAEYWRDTGRMLEFVRKNPEDGTPQYWRAPAETRIADTVWSGIPIYANGNDYPTEKNEALLAQLIDLLTDEGDLVLDCFAGSGTTAALAEKRGRRWIAIDSSKFAVYTMQKRLLSLRAEIGNKGKLLKPKPFALLHAGLYERDSVMQLPPDDYRRFVAELFQVNSNSPPTLNGYTFDGVLRNGPVHIYGQNDAVTEETIDALHKTVGHLLNGKTLYVIAPAHRVFFLQDTFEWNGATYCVLRIPYSIIGSSGNSVAGFG